MDIVPISGLEFLQRYAIFRFLLAYITLSFFPGLSVVQIHTHDVTRYSPSQRNVQSQSEIPSQVWSVTEATNKVKDYHNWP